MPTYSFKGGVNEGESTTIADDSPRDCSGAEYRVGEDGIFVARGRQLIGDLGGVTGTALYEAGFDGSPGYLLAQAGDNFYSALIAPGIMPFTQVDSLAMGSAAMVGTHYANRHYLSSTVANRRVEQNTVTGIGLTSYPIGMSACTLGVTTTLNITGGSNSATIGLMYWVTEYDSVRGIQSIAGSTCVTAPFTDKLAITVVVQGTTINPTADTLRWYRTVDGGVYPDGGLLGETPIGQTFFLDGFTAPAVGTSESMAPTSVLTTPLYGVVTIGGVDTERDAQPPLLSTIFGPYQDSLLGVASDEPRVLRFTAAGYPDSWPALYGIPLETSRNDEIVTGVVVAGRIAVFCNDSVHVIYRLPRDSDSIFAAGEMQEPVTLDRGCVSRRGATTFTPPGSAALAVWVSRDGIWASSLGSSPVPLTDQMLWEDRVDVANLSSCRLRNDSNERRLVFTHRKVTDTTFSTGVWYLDYQEFETSGIRVTVADHGPLADVMDIAAPDGLRHLASIDSRANNGQIYMEANQDVDASHLVNADGAVLFFVRTKEFLPAGPRGIVRLGKASWMHDAMPQRVEHRFFFNRRDDNPEFNLMPDTTFRNCSHVELVRAVNSVSLEVRSAGTISYGLHWLDIEVLTAETRGAQEGA